MAPRGRYSALTTGRSLAPKKPEGLLCVTLVVVADGSRRWRWMLLLALCSLPASCSGPTHAASQKSEPSTEANPASSSTTVTLPAPTTTVAPGYQVVSYHGVHVTVPSSWPVAAMPYLGCAGRPILTAPSVFVGAPAGAESCPAGAIQPESPAGWVWLRPESPRPGAQPSVQSGVTGDVRWVGYEEVGVEVEIGISNPGVATATYNSVGYTPGAPDTYVAGS